MWESEVRNPTMLGSKCEIKDNLGNLGRLKIGA